MASFTDRIPTFNPYVSQQPVESMVQVGMMKQQQYNTNLDKIYQSMSNVAGLDILRDSDQAYLKNKMETVSDKLKVYAAGDFSKSNLTRSVNGLVSSVADDEVIQTAVQSTARVRNEVAKMEKAKADGKSSVVNEWVLNSQIQGWMQGAEAGESFSGAYVPYNDVDKKLMDIYEALPEEEKVTQDIHKRNAKGETLYFGPNGEVTTDASRGWKPQVDQVMLQQEIKGKSSNKIMKAFMAGLSADDLRQLDMNADYHYRGATPETFRNEIRSYGQELKASYQKNIKDIAKELTTNPDLTAEQIEKLELAMNSYKQDLDNGMIDKQIEQQLALVNDPSRLSQYKRDTYKGKYLLEKANSLESLNTKTLWKENPKFNAIMKVKDYNLKVKNYQLKELYERLNYGLAVKKEKRLLDKEAREASEKALEANPSMIIEDLPLENNEEDQITYSDLGNDLVKLTANPNQPQIERQLTNGDVIEKGDIYRLNERALGSINLALGKNMKIDVLENLFIESLYNPHNIENLDNGLKSIVNSKQFKEYYRKRLDLERQKMRLSKTFTGAAEQAAFLDDDMEAFMNERQAFITPARGVITRKETDTFNKDMKNYTVNRMVSAGQATAEGYEQPVYADVTDYESMMEDYADTKFAPLIEAFATNPAARTDEQEQMIENYQKFTGDIKDKRTSIRNQQEEIRDRYVRQHTPKQYSQTATLRPNVKAQRPFYDNVAAQVYNVLDIAEKHGGVIDGTNEKISDNEMISIRNLLKGNKFALTVNKHPDGSGNVSINTDERSFDIKLSSAQIAKIPQLAVDNPYNDALMHISASDNHSTNMFPGENGKSHPAYAYYSGVDFPSLANSDMADRVRADIVGSSFNTYTDDSFTNNEFSNTQNKYALRIYYNKGNNNWISFDTSKEFLTLDGIYSDMKRLNPAMIENEVDNLLSKN